MFILRLLVVILLLVVGSLGISFLSIAFLPAEAAIFVSFLGGLVWGAFVGNSTVSWLMGW